MSIVKIARPEIRQLKPYSAAVQIDGRVRLNANEMPWARKNDSYRRPLNRYPEVRPSQLTATLAARYGCSKENLLVTRGSSEAIDLLIRVFCRAGQDNIAIAPPTFSMYAHYAAVQGAAVIECPTSKNADFAVDIDALLASCDEQTRIIFICSPNNPTGSILDRNDLLRLLQARNDRSAVVVDEAYIEFSQQASVIELLGQFPNLIVLRTLSKALGFAGARCGSVIAGAPVIKLLSTVQAPYAMATPVVESVENALRAESREETDRFARDIVAARDGLMPAIAALPFVQRAWPSGGNFFLLQVQQAKRLLNYCSEHGVLLRYFGDELENCVRISIGSADENSQLLATLTQFAETKP